MSSVVRLRKTLPLAQAHLKVAGDKPGRFRGYASVFDVVDADRDVIVAGAFRDALAEPGAVKMFFNHAFWDLPIGKYLELDEDKVGLAVEGQITLDMSKGADVHAAMKAETVDGLSIGFSMGPDDWEYDSAKGVRIIKRVDLHEISVCTFPANDSARIDLETFKSRVEHLDSVGDIERFLREAGGMSRGLAKAFAAQAREVYRRDAGQTIEPPKSDLTKQLEVLVEDRRAAGLVA